MNGQTLPTSLLDAINDALQPLTAFKEVHFGMEGHEVAEPGNYAYVVEALVNDARRKLVAVQEPLEAEVGEVLLLRATVAHPSASAGEIVGVEVAHV